MCFRHNKTLSYFSGFFSRLWYLTAICGERLLGCISFRPLNLGSAPTPNLTLGMGVFQALSLLHPSNFQCCLGLLFGLLSSSHLSSQPVWLLIPNLPFAVPYFASCNRHAPSTCSAPAQFFQSSVWNPNPGQGPALPPCLGKEFRLAVEAVQKSLTNEKLTTRSTATCLQGGELAESLNYQLSRSCHGGSTLRIHGPDDGNSRENGLFLVGNWC